MLERHRSPVVFQHYIVLHFFPQTVESQFPSPFAEPSSSPPDDRQSCRYLADKLVHVHWTVHDGTGTSTGSIGLVWAGLDL